MNLHELSISQIQDQISSGKITAAEVFSYFQKRTSELNPKLNAFATLVNETPTQLTGQGALAGIPLGIKEVFSQAGVRTSAGSKMLENFVPPYTCTLVNRLTEA
jgi:aspartyl-tRNA(Asn)/glutamyl-tRNA(Gln) amidotransferase subunit A